MLLPDVNILVYAQRTDIAAHDFYGPWFDALIRGNESFALSTLVLSGFVRVTTSAKGPGGATPLDVALASVDNLLRAPNCRLVSPGPRHWELLSMLLRQTGTSGGRVSDAAHAAVAIEHGCELVSRDRDFERFRPHGLRFRWLDVGARAG